LIEKPAVWKISSGGATRQTATPFLESDLREGRWHRSAVQPISAAGAKKKKKRVKRVSSVFAMQMALSLSFLAADGGSCALAVLQ
jgi:hypothetical protein